MQLLQFYNHATVGAVCSYLSIWLHDVHNYQRIINAIHVMCQPEVFYTSIPRCTSGSTPGSRPRSTSREGRIPDYLDIR